MDHSPLGKPHQRGRSVLSGYQKLELLGLAVLAGYLQSPRQQPEKNVSALGHSGAGARTHLGLLKLFPGPPKLILALFHRF